MEILLLEPFFTGSHAKWAEGYARHSQHIVRTLSLGGAHWKWRMHGGAVTLARKHLESNHRPDLILATDMLDLTTFLSLTRSRSTGVTTAVYFHENQINYPWSPKDRDLARNRDRHYGFINFVSALTCDAVFFNSQYHMDAFLSELPRFLEQFPDHRELGQVERIKEKSAVLPLGFDLSRLDSQPLPLETGTMRLPPVLWNHRWEYDKNPDEFFEALRFVRSQGLDFEIAILGERFDVTPDAFTAAKAEFGDRIVQYGYVKDRTEYALWLRRADILPVTSNQDFFGGSVIEAIYLDCFPLLPKRLAFPELFPPELRPSCFYGNFADLTERLGTAIAQIDRIRKISFRNVAEKYDWRRMAPIYDASFSNVTAGT